MLSAENRIKLSQIKPENTKFKRSDENNALNVILHNFLLRPGTPTPTGLIYILYMSNHEKILKLKF